MLTSIVQYSPRALSISSYYRLRRICREQYFHRTLLTTSYYRREKRSSPTPKEGTRPYGLLVDSEFVRLAVREGPAISGARWIPRGTDRVGGCLLIERGGFREVPIMRPSPVGPGAEMAGEQGGVDEEESGTRCE